MADRESSIRGAVIREIISWIANTQYIGKKAKNGGIRSIIPEPEWKCPDIFEHRVIPMVASSVLSKRGEDFGHFRMEYLVPKEILGEKVVLQLHGGGYIGKMNNTYRTFAGLYSEVGGYIPVLSVDYRTAPENPYPAALEDTITAYIWLQEQGYKASQIIVAGDSAGGGLAMALCLYLRDHGMELPCGVIAMSPWTDMTSSGESYQTNFQKDPMFGGSHETLVYNRDYAGECDEREPYLSPVFGDFCDFPPMLIQVGGYEMLLSDSVSVAQKAKKAGVKVRLSVYEGMFHVFQMAMLMMPESKRAWEEIGHFIRLI